MLISVTRGWRGLALVAALLSCLLIGSGALVGVASASHVPQLTDAITDETGVLDQDRTAIQDALERLFDETGVQLYILFVETTGSLDITPFAQAVGDESLSPDDALLVVALTDQTDNLSVGQDLRDRVSQTSLDRVRTDVLEAGLADGDFGGAVLRTVDALGEVFAPDAPGPTAAPVTPGPVFPPPPTDPSPGGSGVGSSLLLFLGALLIFAGLGWIVLRIVALRTERRAAFEEAKKQEQLGREANQLLIKTDDMLRDAEQELGFAEAEFGADLSRPMKDALAGARAELNAAFAIGQQLDDSAPETAEQRRQMMEEVIARSRTAGEVVDKQAAALQRLRDLERNAPEALTRLEAELARVEARVGEVEPARARLSRFAEASTESVADNVDAARQRIEQARQRIAAGREFLASNKASAAAIRASEAEQALGDASTLLDAVVALADSLEAAEGKLKTQLAEATTDIETARAQLSAAAPTGRADSSSSAAAKAFAQAEATLDEARALADAPQPDVLAALRKASEANAQADKVLEGIRDAQAQRQRALQNASAAIGTARTDLARARAYLEGYRHSRQIGREARNRLIESERLIAQAETLRVDDPAQSLALARSADALANEAYSLAQQQAPSYTPFDPNQYRPDDGLGSLVIDAILGGILSGGRRGGGGFGIPTGSARRSPDIFGGGGRGGGWGGGGRSSSGGFGSGGFRGGFGGRSGGFGGGRSSSGRW